MKILLLSLIFSSLTTLACDDGFVKNNHRKIPVNSLYANDMTEKQFKESVKKFETFFAPIMEENHNKELILFNSWGSNTVNAFAEQSRGKWMITVFGGLARHKAITQDGLTLVLCHELGHHLGGYPKKSTNRWSSAEGQADYYATAKCLRIFWKEENNELALKNIVVPELVKNECAITYSNKNDQFMCQRMSLAGKSVAHMIQDLDHDSIDPKFETPDPLVVRVINYMHPYAQCRLDTFFNGAICPVSEEIAFENNDEVSGSCHPRNGDIRGLRPKCWFVSR
jgi:hypothetical protein